VNEARVRRHRNLGHNFEKFVRWTYEKVRKISYIRK